MAMRLGILLLSILVFLPVSFAGQAESPESYVGRGAGNATGKSQGANGQDTAADLCDRCEQMAASGYVNLSSCSNPKCLNRAQQYLPPEDSAPGSATNEESK